MVLEAKDPGLPEVTDPALRQMMQPPPLRRRPECVTGSARLLGDRDPPPNFPPPANCVFANICVLRSGSQNTKDKPESTIKTSGFY